MNFSKQLDRQRVDAGRSPLDRIQNSCYVSTLTVSRYGWYRKVTPATVARLWLAMATEAPAGPL